MLLFTLTRHYLNTDACLLWAERWVRDLSNLKLFLRALNFIYIMVLSDNITVFKSVIHSFSAQQIAESWATAFQRMPTLNCYYLQLKWLYCFWNSDVKIMIFPRNFWYYHNINFYVDVLYNNHHCLKTFNNIFMLLQMSNGIT